MWYCNHCSEHEKKWIRRNAVISFDFAYDAALYTHTHTQTPNTFRWSGKKSAFVWPQRVSCGGFSRHTNTLVLAHSHFTKIYRIIWSSRFPFSHFNAFMSSLLLLLAPLLTRFIAFCAFKVSKYAINFLVVFCIYSTWPNRLLFRGRLYRFVLPG